MKSHLIISAVLGVFATAAVAQQDPAKQANLSFIKLDKNKDGFLSRAEASSDKDLGAVFAKADLNKDGKLDEDEYTKGVAMYQREKSAQYAGDSAITTKVKAALLTAKGLPSTAISVETYKGTVQLSGFVDSKEQIASAGKVASGVSGVKSVQNNLATK
jgi:hyperosmotically inducible protein